MLPPLPSLAGRALIACGEGAFGAALHDAFLRAGAGLAEDGAGADTLVVVVGDVACAARAVRRAALRPSGTCLLVCLGSDGGPSRVAAVTRLFAVTRRRYPEARINALVACGPEPADPTPTLGGGLALDVRPWPEPADIAALCVLLASEAGSAVDGEVLRLRDRRAIRAWLGS